MPDSGWIGARWAIAIAAAIAGSLTIALDGFSDVDTMDLWMTLVGWAFVASGLYTWHRRPANHIGRLMVIAGAVYLGSRLMWQFDWPATFTAGVLLGDSWIVLFAVVVLSFPDGLLKSRFDWIVVVLYAFVIGPVEILWLTFWEPDWSPGNVLAFGPTRVSLTLSTSSSGSGSCWPPLRWPYPSPGAGSWRAARPGDCCCRYFRPWRR